MCVRACVCVGEFVEAKPPSLCEAHRARLSEPSATVPLACNGLSTQPDIPRFTETWLHHGPHYQPERADLICSTDGQDLHQWPALRPVPPLHLLILKYVFRPNHARPEPEQPQQRSTRTAARHASFVLLELTLSCQILSTTVKLQVFACDSVIFINHNFFWLVFT